MGESKTGTGTKAFAARGDAIYERKIRALERTEKGKFAAIDIDSGDFEIDADELAASDRLQARHPQARVWLRRVGSPYARRFRAVELTGSSSLSRIPT